MTLVKDAYNRVVSTLSRILPHHNHQHQAQRVSSQSDIEPTPTLIVTDSKDPISANSNHLTRLHSVSAPALHGSAPELHGSAPAIHVEIVAAARLSPQRFGSRIKDRLRRQSTKQRRPSSRLVPDDDPLPVGGGRERSRSVLWDTYSRLALRTERFLPRKFSPRRRETMSEIRLTETRNISMESFASRLNDYNTYYNGRPEQLRKRQNKKGELVVDGLLSIYWGLRTAIRLQVADDDVKIRHRIDEISEDEMSSDNSSPNRMLAVPGSVRPVPLKDVADEGDLQRTKSVTMRRRVTRNSKHRASINGHYYNHETSVFTPTYGSVTKVRVLSTNNAHDVMVKLFQKFRVENSAHNFSLYIIKETEERRELPRDEFPLISRVLLGPNEQLGKIFLMERNVHKEITSEVAQYIKLDPNILRVFLSKFAEEEEREVQKMRKRFEFYRKMIKRHMREAKQSASSPES